MEKVNPPGRVNSPLILIKFIARYIANSPDRGKICSRQITLYAVAWPKQKMAVSKYAEYWQFLVKIRWTPLCFAGEFKVSTAKVKHDLSELSKS